MLREERQLMKWVEILWVRIFWVAIFWGGCFPGGSLMGGNFTGGNSLGEEFSLNHFLHVMYLFLLLKKLSINIARLSTKRYLLQTLFPATFCLNKRKIFLTQST